MCCVFFPGLPQPLCLPDAHPLMAVSVIVLVDMLLHLYYEPVVCLVFALSIFFLMLWKSKTHK